MKVLHLIDSGGLYGAEKMLLDLVQAQSRSGVDALILSSTNDASTTKPLVVEAKRRKLAIIEWPMADGLNMRQAREIAEFARRQGVQVLHSHGYKFNILLGLLPDCLRKLPRVCTVHGYLAAAFGSKAWLYQQLDRFLLARADATVFVSQAMLSQPAFRRLRVRNPHVIYNGIDFEHVGQSGGDIGKSEVGQQYFGDDASGQPIKLLVAIGRLSPEKGYDGLISVFAELLREEPTARLLIAGEGPERSRLEALCGELSLQGRVAMPGFIDPVSPLFAHLDVLVMNSTTEGMPMTLLEAVAANARIVATAVGGIPEVLADYGKATLVASGNRRQLLQALLTQLGQATDDIRVDNREFIDRFSSATMEKQYRALYQDLVGPAAGAIA